MNATVEKLDVEALRLSASEACRLLKSMAHPERLLLLCQLSQGELCVGEIEQRLGITQPTLSQQLGVLRQEKLVSTRREGKQIYYRLASENAMAVMQVLYAEFCPTHLKQHS